MSSSYEKQTKQITQFAYLSGASLKSINNSYTRSDGETVFPNLADANAMVGSMRKSHGRYMRSDSLLVMGLIELAARATSSTGIPLKGTLTFTHCSSLSPVFSGMNCLSGQMRSMNLSLVKKGLLTLYSHLLLFVVLLLVVVVLLFSFLVVVSQFLNSILFSFLWMLLPVIKSLLFKTLLLLLVVVVELAVPLMLILI